MQSAWSMAWNELKHKPIALAMNGIVSGLFGLALGGMLLGQIYFRADINGLNLLLSIDVLIVMILPFLGSLYLSREYFAFNTMVSNEPFVKRLQFYRMWAIPLQTIAWSRMFYMMICLAVSFIGFLLTFITITWSSYSQLWGIGNYVIFIIVLISFAVALGGLTPYFEFAAKGNKILIGQTLYMLLALFLAIMSNVLTKRPLHLWIIQLTDSYSWIVAGIAVSIAVLGIILFQRLLVSGLQRKEFM